MAIIHSPAAPRLRASLQGAVDFIEVEDRLLSIVTKLINEHEAGRADPWAVSDAPDEFVRRQLDAIVGVRMIIASIEGKREMSQNRAGSDRLSVTEGLAASERRNDQAVSALVL